MSSLESTEKECFEKLLLMQKGYVLDFSDKTFYEFIKEVVDIDIHDLKYCIYGNSKAKKLRAFWKIESDEIVGKVLDKLIERYKFEVDSGEIKKPNELIYDKCIEIKDRLLGNKDEISSTDTLLKTKFDDIDFKNFKDILIDDGLAKILQNRVDEAQKCIGFGAYLAAIILCGSVLECLLLIFISKEPERFNKSDKAPKDKDGKVKNFSDWKLAQMIEISNDIGLLSKDTYKFSHELRNFRNYVHPKEQLDNNFKPDENTAKVAFKVLKMAVLDLQNKRDTKILKPNLTL